MRHCDFAGYLLVTVAERPDGAAVYIHDADDWCLARVLPTLEKAEGVFDQLFSDRPDYTPEFERTLLQWGFFHN